MHERRHLYINGNWVEPSGEGSIEVINPTNEEVIGSVPVSSDSDANSAVEAARSAFTDWSTTEVSERVEFLNRISGLIKDRSENLAETITSEVGTPIEYSRMAMVGTPRVVSRSYAKILDGYVWEEEVRNSLVIKEPIGVVAMITPWNFPIAMITRKVAPGIAAGCTCVLKPAEQTPLSALALAELAERAGIPAGVINIVTGMDGPAIGKTLCDDDRIRKMTFTGSTEVGRILMRQSAGTLKKMSLELGGNAPLIVFDDADIDTAIAGTMASKYRNAGQTCVCANRIFVQDGIYDEFARRLTEATAAMKVGNGMEDGVEQGPIIDGQGLNKIERHVADARAKGAEVLTGGGRHALGGTYFEPTVLTGMTPEMEMFREETFGPVAGLFRFSTDDEAVAMANDTEFGLAAYIFTNNTSRLFRVSEALEYGMVSANTGIFSSEVGPFGGVKSSGLGREGSKYGIDEFLEIKFVCVGL